MTEEVKDQLPREIRGDVQTVRQLLGACKYTIDYYQREYKWQRKHVTELLDDLADKFLSDYKEDHERAAVAGYSHYFLGSIIISERDGQKWIIDGQQRLTTLTLILIFLHRQIGDPEHQGMIANLIFSQKFGKKSFNLDIPERKACMEALYRGGTLPDAENSESIANIVGRYADIEEHFAEEIKGRALPFFADWLMENVHMVQITAYSNGDAYTIFETMNDRGLSLAPTDMLKGYLLANITDEGDRTRASQVWKARLQSLARVGKDENADGIKAWLRSQHAESIRERRRGATPRDFDLIGTEFHRWVRDNAEKLGLKQSADYSRFIGSEFDFYLRWYEKLRDAAETLTQGLECVHYNAQHSFTLQYPLLLAPLRVTDEESTIHRKLRVVAAYVDILIHRRFWNWHAIDHSTMQYAMFLVMKDVRGLDPERLAETLTARLEQEKDFTQNDGFYLHGMNGRQIHRLLARMTDYVETESGCASRYSEYSVSGRKGYEIEHIWANHPERHTDEFPHASEFHLYRNRIGGLLLLPKSFNASYGDLPYAEKREQYVVCQNLLARSLHERAYEHNPGFRRFIETSGLPFQAHEEFKKADLDARQKLYQQFAMRIWNPERLAREARS